MQAASCLPQRRPPASKQASQPASQLGRHTSQTTTSFRIRMLARQLSACAPGLANTTFLLHLARARVCVCDPCLPVHHNRCMKRVAKACAKQTKTSCMAQIGGCWLEGGGAAKEGAQGSQGDSIDSGPSGSLQGVEKGARRRFGRQAAFWCVNSQGGRYRPLVHPPLAREQRPGAPVCVPPSQCASPMAFGLWR